MPGSAAYGPTPLRRGSYLSAPEGGKFEVMPGGLITCLKLKNKSTLLQYNLHIMKCIHSRYAVQCILTKVCSHVSITIKRENVSITQRIPSCLSLVSSHPQTPVSGNPWSAFYHLIRFVFLEFLICGITVFTIGQCLRFVKSVVLHTPLLRIHNRSITRNAMSEHLGFL